MSEKKKLIDGEQVIYSGLFNLKELYKLIDVFCNERGFDKHEKVNEEKVTASGKDIQLLMEPARQVSDYAKHKMKILMKVVGMKDVEVEKDGVKVKLNQGTITIDFSAYLITDIEGKFGHTGHWIIFRTLMDKYVYKRPLRTKEADLIQQTRHLKSLVKSFLNLHRY